MVRCVDRRQFASALAIALLSRGSWVSAQTQPNRRIVLGQSAALTGVSGNAGRHFVQGAKLAFAQANAEVQTGQRTVTLVTLDDAGNIQRCRANTRKLLEEHNAFALFGYTSMDTSLAALPQVMDVGVPFFGPFTGAQRLRNPFNRWVFHVRASYDDEMEMTIAHLSDMGMTRIGIFYHNDSFGQAGLYAANKALKARKLTPVGTGLVDPYSTEVKSAVQVLLAANPQAIVQVGSHISCAAFVQQAREAGYGGTFHTLSSVGATDLSDVLGTAAAGVMMSQVLPSPWQRSQPLTRDFFAAMEQFKVELSASYASLEGYFTARVFVAGLRNAEIQSARGRFNAEALVSGLETLQQSVAGIPIAYSRQNHQGSRFVEMSVLTGDGRVRT